MERNDGGVWCGVRGVARREGGWWWCCGGTWTTTRPCRGEVASSTQVFRMNKLLLARLVLTSQKMAKKR